jgi:hypothetical protein
MEIAIRARESPIIVVVVVFIVVVSF